MRCRREYIASYPAGVLAARFTASEKGALSLNATFSRAESVTSLRASASDTAPWIKLDGTSGQPADEDPIVFSGQASFVADGGMLTIEIDIGFLANVSSSLFCQ